MEIDRFSQTFVREAPDAIIYADAQGIIRSGTAVRNGFSDLPKQRRSGKPSISSFPRACAARHWEGYRRHDAEPATRVTAPARYWRCRQCAKTGQRISIEFTILPFRDDAGRMAGSRRSCAM